MHFTIATNQLLEGIRIAQKGVSKNTQSVLLEGIVFHGEEDELTLFSTDLRISIKTTMKANIIESGRWVLNSSMMGDIVRRLDGDMVDVQIGEEGTVTLKSGRSKVEFQAMNAYDFPAFPQWSADESLTIPTELFRDLVNYTKISVSSDENRLIYTGVKFIVTKDFIEAVSLDGYRISIVKKEVKGNTSETEFIIPLSSLMDVEKLLKEDEDLIIRKSKNHAVLCFGSTILYTRLYEGEFFDYSHMLNEKGETNITLTLRDFVLALERSSVVARGNLNMVKLDIADGNLHISSMGNMGQTEDDMKIDQEGKDLVIAFNARYLIEGLRLYEEEKVILSFMDSLKPVTIRGIKNKEFTYIVLPVRMSQ